VTGSATITGVGKRAAEVIGADMRGRHDRVPDRRAPGKLGGPLPGQQHHRGQASLGQAHQGQPLAGRCRYRVRLGRYQKPRHVPGRPAAGGWPAASASRKAAIAVGHSILVIAWYLLDGDCDDHDLGGDFFTRRDSDRARQRAVAQLQALGYQVTLQPAA
jgi:transposase